MNRVLMEGRERQKRRVACGEITGLHLSLRVAFHSLTTTFSPTNSFQMDDEPERGSPAPNGIRNECMNTLLLYFSRE